MQELKNSPQPRWEDGSLSRAKRILSAQSRSERRLWPGQQEAVTNLLLTLVQGAASWERIEAGHVGQQSTSTTLDGGESALLRA